MSKTKKKKPGTVIGAWEITEGKEGRHVYEGDTQEQLDAVREKITKAGHTFSLRRITQRRAVTVGKSFTLYTNE